MKIVLNKCYGGFGLSPKAIKYYLKLKGKECYFYKDINYKSNIYNKITDLNSKDASYTNTFTKDLGDSFSGSDWKKYQEYYFYYNDIPRDDPDLIKTVEDLGKEANGECAELEVVEFNLNWDISDYDGIETLHFNGSTW